jgi:hypothetical protein
VEKGVDITFKVEISADDEDDDDNEVSGILNVHAKVYFYSYAYVLHYSYLLYLHKLVWHVIVHIIKHLLPFWFQNFLCSCQ